MMIGGGGGSCHRADHGVAITETDSTFLEVGGSQTEYNFGFDAQTDSTPPQSYLISLCM